MTRFWQDPCSLIYQTSSSFMKSHLLLSILVVSLSSGQYSLALEQGRNSSPYGSLRGVVGRNNLNQQDVFGQQGQLSFQGGGGLGGGLGGGGGQGFSGGGGGNAPYQKNSLVEGLLKKAEDFGKQVAELGKQTTETISKIADKTQQGLQQIANEASKNPELLKNVADSQKEKDQALAASNEKSEKKNQTQQEKMNELLNSIVAINKQLFQTSVPRIPGNIEEKNQTSNSDRIQQFQTRQSSGSSGRFGSISQGREPASQNSAINSGPPSNSDTSSDEGHTGHDHGGHSHGFKASNPSKAGVYNQPAADKF